MSNRLYLRAINPSRWPLTVPKSSRCYPEIMGNFTTLCVVCKPCAAMPHNAPRLGLAWQREVASPSRLHSLQTKAIRLGTVRSARKRYAAGGFRAPCDPRAGASLLPCPPQNSLRAAGVSSPGDDQGASPLEPCAALESATQQGGFCAPCDPCARRVRRAAQAGDFAPALPVRGNRFRAAGVSPPG